MYSPLTEFYKQFGKHLTVDILVSVREDLPEDEESDEYKEKEKLRTWYFDFWLPACAGNQHYGPHRRCYYRATKAVKDGNPQHPKVAYVPIHSEALGLVMMMNCAPKWKHVIPKKAENPSWSVPAYSKSDKNTWKYNKTVWSDNKSGKVVAGGWKEGAIIEFNAQLEILKKFRAADRANEHKFYNSGLELLRKKHGVTEEEPAAVGKRRKRKAGALEDRATPKFTEVDEIEDDFSVYSDEE